VQLGDGDPVAVAAVDAIHQGDLGTLESLLAGHRELAAARIRDAKSLLENPVCRRPGAVKSAWQGVACSLM